METRHKLAVTGTGLVIAGIGLSIVGTVLIAPAVFGWATGLLEKGTDGLAAKIEEASQTVGTVAGTLHRSFNQAKRAGLAEMRRGNSHERNAAG